MQFKHLKIASIIKYTQSSIDRSLSHKPLILNTMYLFIISFAVRFWFITASSCYNPACCDTWDRPAVHKRQILLEKNALVLNEVCVN